MSWGLVFDQSLIGRGIRVGVVPPEHILAQLGAHGLSWARLALKKVRPFLFSAIQYVKCGSKKYRGTNHLLLTNRFF